MIEGFNVLKYLMRPLHNIQNLLRFVTTGKDCDTKMYAAKQG